MFVSLILVLEFVRLALELRNGVPASRANRVLLLISMLLIVLTLGEAVGQG